jgi:hypothetical protein
MVKRNLLIYMGSDLLRSQLLGELAHKHSHGKRLGCQ